MEDYNNMVSVIVTIYIGQHPPKVYIGWENKTFCEFHSFPVNKTENMGQYIAEKLAITV